MADIIGTSGPDTLSRVDADPSRIIGLSGDDTLTASAFDVLEGGPGNDLLRSAEGLGGSALYTNATGPVRVSLAERGPQDVGGGQGVDTLENLVAVVGGDYNDTLIGAGPLDPHLIQFGRIPYLGGGGGDDYIYLQSAVDADGGDGNDTIIAGYQSDSIVAGLHGGAGDDSLVGSDGDDGFSGGGGFDTVIGGGGNDSFYAFEYEGPNAEYRSNTVSLGAGSFDQLTLTYAPADAQAVIDLSAGYASVVLPDGRQLAALVLEGVEYVAGVVGGNRMQGSSASEWFWGHNGNDTIFGGDGNDTIQPGAGHNQVNGNKGDDGIIGDSTSGDWLLGGEGNDYIEGRSGDNIINGNLGNDLLVGGTGHSTLRGGQGNDRIVGGQGDELFFGDLGTNSIRGGAGADTFSAGAGHDTVADFDPEAGDRILIAAARPFSAAQTGADVSITFADGGTMVLQETVIGAFRSGWIAT